MPSSWPIYSFVVFAALLGMLIPSIFSILGRLISGSNKPKVLESRTNRTTIGRRVNLRFFQGASISLLLLCMVLLLLPVVVSFQKGSAPFQVLVVILSLLLFMMVGLFYSVKKEDMSWQKNLPNEEESK